MVDDGPNCDVREGPPAVAVKATPNLCMALASASGMSARTTVRINPLVALSVLKGVSCSIRGIESNVDMARVIYYGRRINIDSS